MSWIASLGAAVVSPAPRLEVLFEELAELTGQRNAIDGRIVQIVAEMERDQLCGATGARSVAALVAWKAGLSSAEFPRCAQGMREDNLVLVCPYHHRLHHRGVITISEIGRASCRERV